ncbi:ABC transporter ATP-binding protein [Methanobrevibacter oralis]|uniref:Daunorubicin/doxorubicin resistance ATP-binding protein DrrA n=1 Tax=Methanobrevibacter oralis TaxID=66851 RepID=A0A165ZS43_METOA|nr:ATP-binding cassette domain-containing protein [Methanobrevibacter oralis]KZX11091.1 daunorubicin/doxorubicin resistance ATP-binding protein DrrA [Methanobrevibacter oralis]
MSEYIIETKNLTKKFGKNLAVDSINMKIEKGKIYGLLGKNGAGKTTTMCMLLNLSNSNSGEIFLFGKNVKKSSNKIYSRIGSIIETPGFYENLTGEENLKAFSKLRGNYNKNSIINALKIVSLYEEKNKRFKHYSLGMKQRLGIAAALIHNPDILILDEPVNGLDPIGILEIRNLLRSLIDDYNLTILISSHILSEIEQIADVIAIMDNGKLIEEVNKEELHLKIGKYVDFEVSNLAIAKKILEEEGLRENRDFKSIQDENSIYLLNNFELRSDINSLFVKNGLKVNKINLIEENLEEYFINLVGENSI